MIYPINFEEKIGFSSIRTMLIDSCLSNGGVRFVNKMSFLISLDELQLRLQQTNEFRQMLLMESGFPARNFFDLSEVLSFLKTQGSLITLEDFFDLMLSLKAIVEVKKYIDARSDKYSSLFQLGTLVLFSPNILDKMELIMNEKGAVRDTASTALAEIRSRMIKLNASMRHKIHQSLQLAKTNGWTRDDAEITIRNGRAVIPVLAADKRKIKGFVHDESKTGQLVYLEPIELFENNNELRELELDERFEINRILAQFTAEIQPEIPNLLLAYRYLGLIDFIRAKAKLALQIEAVSPIINQTADFNWRDARHPLLFLSLQKKNRKLVPLDISLDSDKRILIISGPNAGGKSVCLKTVGLLQYMWQCGLLVPMRENSEMRLFSDIFIDIGDEQSIENDLSTYSSHLLNIKNFIEYAQADSLFLIDEFGTGTEPAIGGAIAEAALENLNRKGAYGVVTTHYSNLKAMANDRNGIVNGAMLFDTKELRPLYRLKIGRPGSSFAFEIARKIGLDETILQRASLKSGRKEINLDQRLQEVELEKEKLDKRQKELEFTDNALKELVDRYEAMNSKIQADKQSIIQQARQQAKEILQGANKLIERSVREIKESQAEKDQVKKLRDDIEASKSELEKKLLLKPAKPSIITTKEKVETDVIRVETDLPQVGNQVRIIGQSGVGILEKVKGNQAIVSFDSLKITVVYDKLEKVKATIRQKTRNNQTAYNSILSNIHQRSINFKPAIDIRGMRAEEALSLVKAWIDEAILISYKDLEILHGTGNGILRHIIREYLSSMPEVKSFKDAAIELGGSGKTIINMV